MLVVYELLNKHIKNELKNAIEGKGIKIRPEIGDNVNLAPLRGVLLTLELLSSGTSSVIYYAGKNFGYNVVAHQINGKTLKEVLKNLKVYFQKTNSGMPKIKEVGKEKATFVVDQCATAYGIPNIGRPLCSFNAGMIAGAISKSLKKMAIVYERKCWGLGDKVCEFHIRVLK